MRKRRFIVFLMLLIVTVICSQDASSELAHTGDFSLSSREMMSAWTQPKGGFYNYLIYSYHVSDHTFTSIETDEDGVILNHDGDVKRVETPRFTAHTVTYVGEYGITDTLTVFARIPWIDTQYDETITFSGDDGPDGIGDIHLGLRYNLFNNLMDSDLLMSLQGTLKIPEAYDYDYPLTHLNLGDGQYDATLEVLFGRDWGQGYLMMNAGYTFRFENDDFEPMTFDPSDRITVSFGGGYAVTTRLGIRGTVHWIKSLGNASVSDELIRESFLYGGILIHGDTLLIKDTLGLEQDILNLGIALTYSICPELQASLLYNRDLEGIGGLGTRDAAQVTTYSVAIAYRF